MLGKRQMKKAGSKYKQKSIECFDLRDFESESIIKNLTQYFYFGTRKLDLLTNFFVYYKTKQSGKR